MMLLNVKYNFNNKVKIRLKKRSGYKYIKKYNLIIKFINKWKKDYLKINNILKMLSKESLYLHKQPKYMEDLLDFMI